MKCIVIDAETTGINPEKDELLQLSIIDTNGRTLFHSYLRPVRITEWPDAIQINGITPEMVADAPTLEEAQPAIQRILNEADQIIGYNVNFDLNFLWNAGIRYSLKAEVFDLMEPCSAIYGDYNSYFHSYTWKKLVDMAAYYDYDWDQDAAHDSLADCRATLHIWKRMQESGDWDRAWKLLSEDPVGAL